MATARSRTRTGPAAAHGNLPAGTDTSDGYHHGNLREALLSAAQDLLLERGVEAFTLRECARRAGVSHAAPAHHFGDARGLLTAFATRGFEGMAERMERYQQAAGPDAQDRLRAVGQAYIDFALEHHAHFQLMFASARLDGDDTALQHASGRCFGALQQTLQAVMQARGLAPETLPQRLLLAWSAVHGYAALLIEGQCLLPFGLTHADPAGASAEAARMLSLLEVALASTLPGPAR